MMKSNRINPSTRRRNPVVALVITLARFVHQGVTDVAQDDGYLIGFCILAGVAAFSFLLR